MHQCAAATEGKTAFLLTTATEEEVIMMSQVVYMSSSFWLLALDHVIYLKAKKEATSCKAEKIH